MQLLSRKNKMFSLKKTKKVQLFRLKMELQTSKMNKTITNKIIQLIKIHPTILKNQTLMKIMKISSVNLTSI